MNVENGVCCCYGTTIVCTVVLKKASGKLRCNRSGRSAVLERPVLGWVPWSWHAVVLRISSAALHAVVNYQWACFGIKITLGKRCGAMKSNAMTWFTMSWTSFTVLVEICGKIANCSSGSRGKLKKGDMQVGMKLRTKCRLGFPANISTGTVKAR